MPYGPYSSKLSCQISVTSDNSSPAQLSEVGGGCTFCVALPPGKVGGSACPSRDKRSTWVQGVGMAGGAYNGLLDMPASTRPPCPWVPLGEPKSLILLGGAPGRGRRSAVMCESAPHTPSTGLVGLLSQSLSVCWLPRALGAQELFTGPVSIVVPHHPSLLTLLSLPLLGSNDTGRADRFKTAVTV